MRFHRSGAHRIALILAILAITCEISWASKRCKGVVMDAHMKRCRLGAERAKRALEKFDLQKYDEKYGTKRQGGLDYSRMKDYSIHSVPRKRQLSYGQIGGIALPIVTGAMNSAAKARAYATSTSKRFRTGYDPSLMGFNLGRPEYYPSAPYSFGRGFVPTLPSAFNDDLDLNDEELNELYNDIYERLPRALKDEAWKVFLETASKCCQNADRCLKETTHVPCLENRMS